MLAVTPGEPSGVGPECLLKLKSAQPALPLVAVADAAMLGRTARQLGLDIPVTTWQPGQPLPADGLACFPVELPSTEIPGTLNADHAPYVLQSLRDAVGLVQSGAAHALVTGPVHKGIINDAGIAFSGHTEFLAELAGVERVVMMLATDSLRVALVTTHLPLREVPDAITRESVGSAITITHQALTRQFGIEQPVIQVLGLNPHAGEGGHLGHEDDAIIRPVIEELAAQGMHLTGPVPADTAFNPPHLRRCDAVLAMYHDQGLPTLKHAGFGKAVNITLGLPFIRTSVDHGTALDIAGQGIADESSLGHACRVALELRP